MWLVIFKELNYPSVIECETEEQANKCYEELKRERFRKKEYIEDGKLYKVKVEKSYGELKGSIRW